MALFGINNSSFLNLAQGLGGFLLMQQGTAAAAQGARNAGAGAMAAANYNANLVSFNLNRQLDDLGRTINRTIASQRAAAGASNLSVSSASFLAVANTTMNQFEREILRRKNSAQIEREGILFEGRSRQAAFERQAEQTETQGAVAAFQQLPKLVQSIGGIF